MPTIDINYPSGHKFASIRKGIYTPKEINDTFSTIYENKYFIILKNNKIIYTNLFDIKPKKTKFNENINIVFLPYDYESEVINLLENNNIISSLIKLEYRDQIICDIIDELNITNEQLCYIPNRDDNYDFIIQLSNRINTDNIHGDNFELAKINNNLLVINSNKEKTYTNLYDIVIASSPSGFSDIITNYPIKTKNRTINFIFRIFYSLKSNGKAGIIIPRYILINEKHRLSRSFFLKKCNIYKIIDFEYDDRIMLYSIIFFIKDKITKIINYNDKLISIDRIKENNYNLNFNLY